MVKVKVKVKVKWSRYRPGVAQRVGRGIALLFYDRGTRRRVSGQQHAPAALYPRERPGTSFYRRLGGPQGRSGRAENLIPTGIRSRTVQPVVSRYTNWAIRPTNGYGEEHKSWHPRYVMSSCSLLPPPFQAQISPSASCSNTLSFRSSHNSIINVSC